MDNGTRKGDRGERSSATLMKGDGFFSSRVLSRNSSVGCSSRIYYRNPDGVPFNWEMQPGMPKNLPKADDLPPLSPPPAILSLGLPKPSITIEEPKPPRLSRLMFWRKKKNKLDSERKVTETEVTTDNKYFEGCSYSGELMESSPPRSSTTSSSSLSLSNVTHSSRLSSFRVQRTDPMGGSYGCGPWKLSWVVVRAARRQ